MISKTRFTIPVLVLLFLTQPIFSQPRWRDCSKLSVSPDENFVISCSTEVGDPVECTVTVLSLKGKGIKDSIIVSRTATHDCPPPQFFWSRNAPLLIVETSKGVYGCDGARTTQVFDLEQQTLVHATDGRLFLYDEKRDLAILYNGHEERDYTGNVTKFWFNLDGYQIIPDIKLPICSLETYTVDCTRDFDIKFDADTPNMVNIQFLDNQNRMDRSEFKIRY